MEQFKIKMISSFLLLQIIIFHVKAQSEILNLKIQNLIQNGNFTQNNCILFRCISNDPQILPGWTPDPQLQIGFASAFTDHFQYRTQRIIQLTPNKDSCIKQNIRPLQPGFYKLTVESVARINFPLKHAKYTISLNATIKRTVSPSNYDVHFETLFFEVKNGCGAQLKLCGIGMSTKKNGAVIKSVTMVAINLTEFQTGSSPMLFCKFSPQVSGIFLASHSNAFFEKTYNLDGQNSLISFNYEIISEILFTFSETKILIDGIQVKKVNASESGNRITIESSNLTIGQHVLSFCLTGNMSQQQHFVKISDILVEDKVCVSKWTGNLIKNGDFQFTDCLILPCIFQSSNYLQSNLPFWLPEPSLQIGNGKDYNLKFNPSKVIELNTNQNSCIKQLLILKTGKYILSYDRAGSQKDIIDFQRYEVKLNGNVLKNYTLSKHQVKRQRIQFQLSSVPAESLLQFCGFNSVSAHGVILDNIELIYLDSCFQTKIKKNQLSSSSIIDMKLYPQQGNISIETIQIQSNQTQCHKFQYQLLGGDLEVRFNFSVLSTTPVSSSALIVFFDSKVIHTVYATENGNQIIVKVPNVTDATHLLEFCPHQNSKESVHTLNVQGLVLQERQCIPGWTGNLIKNGDFENTSCQNDWCVFFMSSWSDSLVEGWRPYPQQMQIAFGTNFNLKVGKTYVNTPDAYKNSCVQQFLNLKPGKYVISFITCAQMYIDFSSQGFDFRINGKTIKRILHTNYDLQTQTIYFTLDMVYENENILQFCGIGQADGQGSMIDDVEMFYYDQCQHFQVFTYKS